MSICEQCRRDYVEGKPELLLACHQGPSERIIGLLTDIRNLLSSVIHVDKLSGRSVVDIEGSVDVDGTVDVREPR